jgi:hypothetical protein
LCIRIRPFADVGVDLYELGIFLGALFAFDKSHLALGDMLWLAHKQTERGMVPAVHQNGFSAIGSRTTAISRLHTFIAGGSWGAGLRPMN